MKTPLALESFRDNGPLPGAAPAEFLRRDGQVSIEARNDNEIVVRAWGEPIYPQDGNQYKGIRRLKKSDLLGAINRCRDIWQTQVIGLKLEGPGRSADRPFVDKVDLSQGEDPRHFEKAGLELARAGNDLFNTIFNWTDPQVHEIGLRLAEALRKKSRVITFHSEEVFIPWRMMYTPPDPDTQLYSDDASWDPAGFWGYGHVMEQQLDTRGNQSHVIELGERKLRCSLNVDDTYDSKNEVEFVKKVVDFFSRFASIEQEHRYDLPSLRAAFLSEAFDDDLLYFGCHGEVGGNPKEPNLTEPAFRLGDKKWITRSELNSWFNARGTPLQVNPIFLINACEGGQMSSLFYGSFAAFFLEQGAHCLIGPQIELPAMFAADFATRFLDRFFSGRQRIGEILRDLTRETIDSYKNPLGLIYSQYYGLDTYMREPVR